MPILPQGHGLACISGGEMEIEGTALQLGDILAPSIRGHLHHAQTVSAIDEQAVECVARVKPANLQSGLYGAGHIIGIAGDGDRNHIGITGTEADNHILSVLAKGKVVAADPNLHQRITAGRMDPDAGGTFRYGSGITVQILGQNTAVDLQFLEPQIGPDHIDGGLFHLAAHRGGGHLKGHASGNAVQRHGQCQLSLTGATGSRNSLILVASADDGTDLGGILRHPGDPNLLAAGHSDLSGLPHPVGIGFVLVVTVIEIDGHAQDLGAIHIHIVHVDLIGFADLLAVGGGHGEGVQGLSLAIDIQILEHASAHLAGHQGAVGIPKSHSGHTVVGHHSERGLAAALQIDLIGSAGSICQQPLAVHIHTVDAHGIAVRVVVHSSIGLDIVQTHSVHLLILAVGGNCVEDSLVGFILRGHHQPLHAIAELPQLIHSGVSVITRLCKVVKVRVSTLSGSLNVHKVCVFGDRDLVDGGIIRHGGGLPNDFGRGCGLPFMVDGNDLTDSHIGASAV